MRTVVTVEDGLPAVPMGEEDLKTVLGNLVGNAVKYGRQSGQLAVRARLDGKALVVEVEDSGIGILPENLPRLFDEFFREKRAETRDIEGNGLGLAIVKRLVERAGGRIEVESRVGEGTTFRLRFEA
jgi:two-component system phosphate regulon sensor histidine kinase PhoR